MHASSLADFLVNLETVPWFSTISEPITDVPNVLRIRSWDEWPGPMDDGVEALNLRHGALYEELVRQDSSLKVIWDQIHAAVFRRATSAVPFDSTTDAWHGPTTAVWQAAWTAGLIGLCLASGHARPEDLQRQWEWFLRGHWPCGYERIMNDGEPGPLVVF